MAKSASSQSKDIELLAGEYVLGVSSAEDRRQFEELSLANKDYQSARIEWENRLEGLNTDYKTLTPPASVKAKLDARLFQSTALATSAKTGAKAGLWNALGFWRGLGLAGTAAAIALGAYSVRLNDRLVGARTELTASLEEKSQFEDSLKAFESELASRNQQLTGLEAQVADNATKLKEADALLVQAKADLNDALSKETPLLVVSLDSGDTDYRFLAVHEEGSDQVRMTLVSGAVDQSKDFELWLVKPEKDTVSLGVIESGKTAVELTPELAKILENGGLLAVSLEQKGGSPTGVAQGPVLAVGTPQPL